MKSNPPRPNLLIYSPETAPPRVCPATLLPIEYKLQRGKPHMHELYFQFHFRKAMYALGLSPRKKRATSTRRLVSGSAGVHRLLICGIFYFFCDPDLITMLRFSRSSSRTHFTSSLGMTPSIAFRFLGWARCEWSLSWGPALCDSGCGWRLFSCSGL